MLHTFLMLIEISEYLVHVMIISFVYSSYVTKLVKLVVQFVPAEDCIDGALRFIKS